MDLRDLQKALDATTANDSFYKKADRYMDGTVAEHFASPTLARVLKGSANRFRINYARVPVTALCNRMKISSFTVSENEPASAYLNDQWTAMGMSNLYRDVHFKAAGAGSAYLMAWPNEDGVSIDASVVDASMTRIHYDPENPSRALFGSRIWEVAEGTKSLVTRVNLYYRDRIEKWVSKQRGSRAKATSFQPFVDLYEDTELDGVIESAPVWPIPNPYGILPIFHFHVGSGYGRPVNKDAWEPQDAINKLSSTMMATVDYEGAPQRYALEHPDRNVEDDAVDEWDEDTSLGLSNDPTNLRQTTDKGLRSGPGGMWFLNAKEVGQFDPADPKVFLEPMTQYVKGISTTTETPLHAFHGMGDAPSGESLRAANAPLNDNVVTIEGWLEPTWLEFMSFICEIGEFKDVVVSMTWANPEKADDKDFWTSVTTKISAGVPKDVALVEAGYSKETVDQWAADSMAASGGAGTTMTMDPQDLKAAADAMGVLIRSGVEPMVAAQKVGLAGLVFTGAIPTSLRPAAADAASLEGGGTQPSLPTA